MRDKFNKVMLSMVLLLIASASFAQSNPDPTSPMWTNLASIANDFFNNFNMFENADKLILGAGLAISQKIQGTALALGGALALINILWVAIEHFVLKSRESILPPMLYAVVIAIITGAALHSYSTLAQGAIDFFMGVTNTVAGDASTQKVQSIGNQLTNLTINGIKSALESVRDFSWSAKEVLLVLVDVLLTLIIGLFCMVMAMLMFVSVVSSIFTGTLMAGLAIALGPLFVATIASGFTKVFFDRWFGFFCSALFVKVVVMTMLTLLLGIFDAPTNTQNAVGQMNTGGFAFGKLLVLAVSLWIMKQLMEQAPNIASALMPGGLGVGVKGSLGTAVAAAAGVVGAGISAATGAASGAIAKAGGGANAAGMAAKANAAASSLATGAMNNAQKSAGLSPGSTQRSGPASPPPSQPTPAPTDQSLGKRSQTRNG